MLLTEFEWLTGFYVPNAFYNVIEKEYLKFDGDKHAFCKAFENNTDGLAEKLAARFNLEQTERDETVQKRIEDLKKQIKNLEAALEREQEWKPYEGKHSVPQSAYDDLRNCLGVKRLSVAETKDFLYERFGFAREKVEILQTLPVYEISRHRQLREVGRAVREPLYYTSDWHYICFECSGLIYEVYNDSLNPCC